MKIVESNEVVNYLYFVMSLWMQQGINTLLDNNLFKL
jgi:hypothetical protein